MMWLVMVPVVLMVVLFAGAVTVMKQAEPEIDPQFREELIAHATSVYGRIPILCAFIVLVYIQIFLASRVLTDAEAEAVKNGINLAGYGASPWEMLMVFVVLYWVLPVLSYSATVCIQYYRHGSEYLVVEGGEPGA